MLPLTVLHTHVPSHLICTFFNAVRHDNHLRLDTELASSHSSPRGLVHLTKESATTHSVLLFALRNTVRC